MDAEDRGAFDRFLVRVRDEQDRDQLVELAKEISRFVDEKQARLTQEKSLQ